MMKSHLILRLHRIILIAALFLAASCKEDDTSVQLKAPQTLTAIPSETSLLIEWGGVDEAAAYELEARSDDYAFSTRVEDTRYELTGLEAYTEYEYASARWSFRATTSIRNGAHGSGSKPSTRRSPTNSTEAAARKKIPT